MSLFSRFSPIFALIASLGLGGCPHWPHIIVNMPYFQPGYGYGGGRVVNHAPPPRVVYVQQRPCCY